MKSNKLIAALLIQFIFSIYAFAIPAGRIMAVKGVVEKAGSDNKFVKVKVNDLLDVGDIIRTQKDSAAKITLNDRSEINLSATSEFKVDNNAVTKGGETQKPSTLSVLFGQLRVKASKSEDGKTKMVVKTRSATMGVRGTTLDVISNPFTGNSTLVTLEGNVKLLPAFVANTIPPEKIDAAFNDTSKAVEVKTGQASASTPNSPVPTEPVKINMAQLDAMKRTDLGFTEAKPENKPTTNAQSIIPPGVPAKAMIGSADSIKELLMKTNPEVAEKIEQKIEAAKNADPNGKMVDNRPKLPDGVMIDFKTGSMIAPPAGSPIDPITGTYLVLPSMGTINAKGEIVPPKGFVIDPVSGMVPEHKATPPEVLAKAAQSAGIVMSGQITAEGAAKINNLTQPNATPVGAPNAPGTPPSLTGAPQGAGGTMPVSPNGPAPVGANTAQPAPLSGTLFASFNPAVMYGGENAMLTTPPPPGASAQVVAMMTGALAGYSPPPATSAYIPAALGAGGIYNPNVSATANNPNNMQNTAAGPNSFGGANPTMPGAPGAGPTTAMMANDPMMAAMFGGFINATAQPTNAPTNNSPNPTGPNAPGTAPGMAPGSMPAGMAPGTTAAGTAPGMAPGMPGSMPNSAGMGTAGFAPGEMVGSAAGMPGMYGGMTPGMYGAPTATSYGDPMMGMGGMPGMYGPTTTMGGAMPGTYMPGMMPGTYVDPMMGGMMPGTYMPGMMPGGYTYIDNYQPVYPTYNPIYCYNGICDPYSQPGTPTNDTGGTNTGTSSSSVVTFSFN